MGERPAVRSPGKGQLMPSPRLATRAFMRRSSLKQRPPVLHPSLFRMIFLHYGVNRPIALAQVLGAVLEKWAHPCTFVDTPQPRGCRLS